VAKKLLSDGVLEPWEEQQLAQLRTKLGVRTSTHERLVEQYSPLFDAAIDVAVDAATMQEFEVGTQCLVRMNIGNTGQWGLEQTEVTFRTTLDGDAATARAGTLEPGGRQALGLPFSPKQAGQYELQGVIKTTNLLDEVTWYQIQPIGFRVGSKEDGPQQVSVNIDASSQRVGSWELGNLARSQAAAGGLLESGDWRTVRLKALAEDEAGAWIAGGEAAWARLKEEKAEAERQAKAKAEAKVEAERKRKEDKERKAREKKEKAEAEKERKKEEAAAARERKEEAARRKEEEAQRKKEDKKRKEAEDKKRKERGARKKEEDAKARARKRQEDREAGRHLVVDASGEGDHTTLAAAVEAAAPGALIELSAGEYRERIVADKPLRLHGLGEVTLAYPESGDAQAAEGYRQATEGLARLDRQHKEAMEAVEKSPPFSARLRHSASQHLVPVLAAGLFIGLIVTLIVAIVKMFSMGFGEGFWWLIHPGVALVAVPIALGLAALGILGAAATQKIPSYANPKAKKLRTAQAAEHREFVKEKVQPLKQAALDPDLPLVWFALGGGGAAGVGLKDVRLVCDLPEHDTPVLALDGPDDQDLTFEVTGCVLSSPGGSEGPLLAVTGKGSRLAVKKTELSGAAHGVVAEGCRATIEGSTFSEIREVGVWFEGRELTMKDSEFTKGNTGIGMRKGKATVRGCRFSYGKGNAVNHDKGTSGVIEGNTAHDLEGWAFCGSDNKAYVTQKNDMKDCGTKSQGKGYRVGGKAASLQEFLAAGGHGSARTSTVDHYAATQTRPKQKRFRATGYDPYK